MSTITINGERVEMPMPPLMSNLELRTRMIQAITRGDLYCACVCQIAMDGHPGRNTWERLDLLLKMDLFREYRGSVVGGPWHREKAQLELLRQSQAGAA